MTPDNNLASDISDYVGRAQEIETTRKALVDRLLEVVKTEIIPEIIPLLPLGYTIDSQNSDVYSTTHNQHRDQVPTGFRVALRLLYDGKPTYFEDRDFEIGKIQKDLKPKLEEMAKKYNVESIIPFGEPLQMG